MARRFPPLNPLRDFEVVARTLNRTSASRCDHRHCRARGVYRALTEQGIKKAELARRLGWHMPQVDRLFDLLHALRLDQGEAAPCALGRQLEGRVARV